MSADDLRDLGGRHEFLRRGVNLADLTHEYLADTIRAICLAMLLFFPFLFSPGYFPSFLEAIRSGAYSLALEGGFHLTLRCVTVCYGAVWCV